MRLSSLILLPLAFSLTACGGDKSDTTPAQSGAAPAASDDAGTVVASTTPPEEFQSCAVCHQGNGEGLAGAFPPLKGSEYVMASNVDVPILIVLKGIMGPLTVHGAEYNGVMMPYGGAMMTDAEVAKVLTYVRSAWGNDAGPVSVADVGRVRDAYTSLPSPLSQADVDKLMK